MAVAVVERCEQLDHRGGRIGDRAAVNSAVQVHRGTGNAQLERQDPAQPVGKRRPAASDHAGIGDGRDIAAQFVAMFSQKRRQVRATDLLFAFDQEDHVDGKFSVLSERFLDADDVRENLAFVVGRAAGIDHAGFDARLERRRFPQIERIGGLHVVMAVDEHRRPARAMVAAGEDHRMPAGGIFFNREPDFLELLDQPIRARIDLRRIGWIGGYAGEFQELDEVGGGGV